MRSGATPVGGKKNECLKNAKKGDESKEALRFLFLLALSRVDRRQEN